MRSRLPVLLAITALLMLAAVVARGTSAVPLGQGRPLLGFLRLPVITSFIHPPAPQEVRPAGHSVLGDVLGWIVLLMPVALLAVALLAALVLAFRRPRPSHPVSVPGEEGPGVAEPPPAVALLLAARAARSELARHEGGRPSDAVIGAWVRLEEVAARSGIPRLAHQTPTEFAGGVAAEHAAAGAALDQLRRLYQRARFGTRHPVGHAEADAAGAALDAIVRALDREPVNR